MRLFSRKRFVPSYLFTSLLAVLYKGIDALTQDAPFTYPDQIYRQSIYCPRGIMNQTGGIILLVHGAATTGEGTWSESPFNEQLANTSPGYDVCWLNLPWKGLGDLQESAEFVAFGIKYLSSLSPASGHRINVIGHSQGGGANIQWALTFWPSIQPLVAFYFSIAGTFKGASLAALTCSIEQLWGGCLPSPLQLETKSRYMTAQNNGKDEWGGAKAHVKTISIFSSYDQVLLWEGSYGKNSYLEGSTMVRLQSKSVCGLGHVVGHLGIVEDQATFKVIQAMLQAGDANLGLRDFDRSSCHHLVSLWRKVILRFPYALHVMINFITGPSRLHKIFKEYTHLRLVKEPGLQDYVCKRGYATNCLPPKSGFADVKQLSQAKKL